MKKNILSMALIAGALFSANAQTLSFLDGEGAPIANGSSYTFQGWTIFPEGVVNGQEVEYAMVTIDPELSITSSGQDKITVSATSKTNALFQLCAGGNCVNSTLDNPTITKTGIDIKEGQVIPLQLEAILQFMAQKVEIPYYEISVEAWSETNPSNKINMTLKMGSIEAGVESLIAGKDFVTVNGNILSYDVTGSALLNVYNLGGKAVVSRQIAGTGDMDMSALPKGIYVYKLEGKKGISGKFVIE